MSLFDFDFADSIIDIGSDIFDTVADFVSSSDLSDLGAVASGAAALYSATQDDAPSLSDALAKTASAKSAGTVGATVAAGQDDIARVEFGDTEGSETSRAASKSRLRVDRTSAGSQIEANPLAIQI